MSPHDVIADEIRTLGYAPEVVALDGFPCGPPVVFDYPVPTGRFKGCVLRVGISFQEDAYPEYPPHFVGVAGITEARRPIHARCSYQGTEWAVFSVPPSDFWDGLAPADKNMKIYFAKHLLRFWQEL